MQTLPISKVKDRLNELVDSASLTHERVTITKNGSPAAVLISVAEWETQLTQSLPDNLKGSLPSIEEIEAELSKER